MTVHYLDPCKGDLHALLRDMAEDAEIDGALVLYMKDGDYHVRGGGMKTSELAALALLLDEMARQALFDGE